MATKKSQPVVEMSQRPLLRVEGLPAAARLATPVGFSGAEAVSQPFELLLEIETPVAVAAKAEKIAQSCLGQSLAVEVAAGGESRWFHGEVESFHLNETGDDDAGPVIVLELRPALWRLSRSVDTRLFAGKTARQIIDSILCSYGLAGEYVWRTGAGHAFKERPHCWQFEESDLDFVSRLLSEEGFHYWFTFTRGGHQMIIARGPEGVAACSETLRLGAADAAASQGLPCISFLRRSWRATPGECVVRGRAQNEPATVVEGRSSDTARQSPPGASGTVHETDSAEGDVTACRNSARRRLDSVAALARTVEGSSNACLLAAGCSVRIDTTPRKPGFDLIKLVTSKRYQLTSVHHDADQRTNCYRNRFEGVPDDAPLALPELHRRPTFPGHSAAEVMEGPDEQGRYRLKFDLDRTGTTSSWVPMAHPEDVVFLPQVGDRVGIDFNQGNLDRPVIREHLHTAATLPFDPQANSRLGGITTPAHKLWFESGEAQWALLEIAGRLRELIKGTRETVIEKDVIEEVLGAVHCTVEQSWAGKIGQQYGLQAKKVCFEASDQIVLMVGKNCIIIDKNGITINGLPLLDLNPPGGASASAPTAPLAMPESPRPAASAKAKEKSPARTPVAKSEPVNVADLDAPAPNATDAKTGRSVSLDGHTKPRELPRSLVDARRIDETTIADALTAQRNDQRCADKIDAIAEAFRPGDVRQYQQQKQLEKQVDAVLDLLGINSKKEFERQVTQEADARQLGNIIVDQEKNGTDYYPCPIPLTHRK